MSDNLPQRLRDLYVSTGLPYLQWAADRIDADAREIFRLQSSHSELYLKAMADEALMRQALEALIRCRQQLQDQQAMPDGAHDEFYDAAESALRTRLGESKT